MAESHRAVARRTERGWAVNVADVGETRTRALTSAARAAADLLAAKLGGDPAEYEVDLVVDLDGLERDADRIRQRISDAERELEAARLEWRQYAERLRGEGLSTRESAIVMKVTYAWVDQLLKPKT